MATVNAHSIVNTTIRSEYTKTLLMMYAGDGTRHPYIKRAVLEQDAHNAEADRVLRHVVRHAQAALNGECSPAGTLARIAEYTAPLYTSCASAVASEIPLFDAAQEFENFMSNMKTKTSQTP